MPCKSNMPSYVILCLLCHNKPTVCHTLMSYYAYYATVPTVAYSPVMWKNLVHLFFLNLRKRGKIVLFWHLVSNYETNFFSVVLIGNMKAFFKTFAFLTLPDLTR